MECTKVVLFARDHGNPNIKHGVFRWAGLQCPKLSLATCDMATLLFGSFKRFGQLKR